MKTFAQRHPGKEHQEDVISQNNLTDIIDYNLMYNKQIPNKIHLVLNIEGKNNFERLSKVSDIYCIFDWVNCCFTKVDSIDLKTNQLYEIKKIGKNDKVFLLTDPLAIKDDGDNMYKWLGIEKYNELIYQIHEIYGDIVCKRITDEFINNNIKIHTGTRVLEVNKDFTIFSSVGRGRLPGTKRWEIMIKIQ